MIPLWQPTVDGEILRNLRGVSEPFAYTSPGTPMAPLPQSVEDLLYRWRAITLENYNACRRRHVHMDEYHPFASRLAVEIDRLQSTGPIVAAWGDEWYAAAMDYANTQHERSQNDGSA